MRFEDFKNLKQARKHPGDEEHRLQCDCVTWFKLTFPDFAKLMFAVPNGGRRDASTGRRLKAEGVTAGVADLLFLHARGGFYGLAIELKTARGRQSEEQKIWQGEIERQGYKYIVVRSFDEFEKMILDYFKLNVTEVSEIIPDFETAREYLGEKTNLDFTVSQKVVSRNTIRIEDVTRLVQSLNPSHIEALIALNELFTIAQAWNKEDGFVPDLSNRNQYKYFPWFTYNNDAAGFVYANTNYSATYADANIGSRLCFKSVSRAEQFGKQFAHLYNKVFLLNK